MKKETSGKDKSEQFEVSLRGKKVPVLTLDPKWYRLLDRVGNEDVKALEEKLNALLKRQGKVNTETREIKKIKKRLMEEIVGYADEAAAGSAEADQKLAESKRLLEEANERLARYDDEILDLPQQIEEANRGLMRITMEHCYDTMQENTDEIEELDDWIRNMRIQLKKNLIRKQEMEAKNHEIYAFMHDVFGPDVMELFDLRYNPEEQHPVSAKEAKQKEAGTERPADPQGNGQPPMA